MKRGLDVALGSVLLVLAAPAMLTIAVAIRATSRGPALFAQPRLGRHGREFRMYKFRSMVLGAEKHEERLAHRAATGRFFKIQWDPRVTRVGRLLRRYSLDELPQLFNVLKGDMSLVGPRPLLLVEAERHPELLAHPRWAMRPGMTGLWQVSGRSRCTESQRLRLDRQYVADWSLRLDLRILVETPRAVVEGDGAW